MPLENPRGKEEGMGHPLARLESGSNGQTLELW